MNDARVSRILTMESEFCVCFFRLWLFEVEGKMKYFAVFLGSIIVFVVILFYYNQYDEYSYYGEYSDAKAYDDYLIDYIQIVNSKIENTDESPFSNLSNNFIDIKKHEFKKNIKKEFKHKPICNKPNLDSKEMMQNAPCFLSHLHFATPDI